jgi:hypothetical protein
MDADFFIQPSTLSPQLSTIYSAPLANLAKLLHKQDFRDGSLGNLNLVFVSPPRGLVLRGCRPARAKMVQNVGLIPFT